MKNIFLGIIMLFVIFPAWSQQEMSKNTKLVVYYFHITDRCQTCTKIEASTKAILEQQYAKQLEDKTIVFKSFNVDLPENKELVKKYQAYGATLAFTYIVNGAENGIEDLTGMAFSKINDEKVFSSELKQRIDEAIK